MPHDLDALRRMTFREMTKGQRIAAAKGGVIPPIRSQRERQLRSRYGMTLEDYDEMLAGQDGKCAACKKEWHNSLYVDHDHKLGHVRGLLCAACNTAVGYLESGRESLTAAMKYLSDLPEHQGG